jgi:hypothetical protein
MFAVTFTFLSSKKCVPYVPINAVVCLLLAAVVVVIVAVVVVVVVVAVVVVVVILFYRHNSVNIACNAQTSTVFSLFF